MAETGEVPHSEQGSGRADSMQLRLVSDRGAVVPAATNSNIILANTVILQQPPQNQELSQAEKQQKVDEFISEVNARSKEQSRSSIARDFDGDIQEPENEVAPVLVVTNFYRGETVLDEVDYSVPDERRRKTLKKKKREVEVHLPDLHKHGRYIMLVGGAGSGKTTLIKRYCAMVLENRILKDVKVVHLINVRDLSKEELTPREMLFGKFLVGDHMKDPVKYGYQWMQKEENQSGILLAFDGIDTAPWVLNDDNHDLMSYDDKRSAPTVLYNILRGHLFKRCMLLLTSREYGITSFPRSIRPDSVIALKGFTRKSIMILVKELGGDKGDDIWNSLKQKSVNLMLLCTTPLFLIFTIIVYKKYDDPPENLSGIIITIIESHIHSMHKRVSDKSIRDIIEKLKTLSLQGLREGKVVFVGREFSDLELNLDDVKDLIISAPSPSDKIPSQRLLEEDYSYFFCHQALQESLAALKVAGKEEEEDFRNFVGKYLHTPKYIVVRQILCGVLFNDETTRLARRQAKVPLLKMKQETVLKTIEEELSKCDKSPMDTLNLLISLRECGGQQNVIKTIKKCILKMSLSGIPLTPSDMHAAASVTRHCNRLSIMQLVNCHLDGHSLQVLAEGLKGSDVEITVFDVSFNSNLRKESMFHLHEICIRGQGLNYWQCGFRQRDILMFNEREAQRESSEASDPSDQEVIKRSFEEDKVLDLGCYNVENHYALLDELVTNDQGDHPIRVNVVEYEPHNSMNALCNLLLRCKNIGEFAVSESELTESQLKRIEDVLRQKQVDSVNVFLTPNILDKGWSVLGRIAKTCLTRNIFITACSLTEVKLTGFKFSLQGAKIYKLDVSRNNDMDEYCLREIGDVVEICGVEELVMGYCNLRGEHVKYLKRSVSNGKINRIDMSGNDKMEPVGYYALGEIVLTCGVQLLDISECNPSAEEIANFKVAKHDAKITKLNVSRNRNMGASGLRDVGEMVGESTLDELFIRQCELEKNSLRSFRVGLGNSKIRHLDFGLYFMKVRPTTDEEVEILVDMLPNITEQLTLNAWDIDERGRRRLQNALDALPFVGEGIKVMFDRGKDEFIRQRKPA